MKRRNNLSIAALLIGLAFLQSCSESFLEITPNGALDKAVLASYEGVDAMLISAYAMIDGLAENIGGWQTASSGWVYGSIRGMEANKGGDGGDLSGINSIQTYTETSTNPFLDLKWQAIYEGVSRANETILTANLALEKGNITAGEHESFVNQARALRGIYHFWAWKLWGIADENNPACGSGIAYLDENTDVKTVTNTSDVRAKILADLEAGTRLATNMKQIGRVNKTVMQVFYAKGLMQMMHDYDAALTQLSAAENGTNPAGGEIGLMDNYGDIFNADNRNDKEAVYTVQYSVNDNSGGWNAGRGEVQNFPYKPGASPGGCCGLFCPTQDFVNSFRTDDNGLPFIDLEAGTYSYNDEMVTNDQGIKPIRPWEADKEYLAGDYVTVADPADPYRATRHYIALVTTIGDDPLSSPKVWDLDFSYVEYAGNLDPRLDWSVGRRGLPYWDWGLHTGQDWIRDQSFSGPYSPKKQVYKQSQEGTLTELDSWTSGYTANGYRMIRYADLLLLKAECEAMTGSDDLGFGEVNRIRARAANTAGFVHEDDGSTPAANYVIAEYPGPWGSQDEAMHAIKFERKLELGQEGHRYYDLQRWGEVVSELQRIMDYESTMQWGSMLYYNTTIGPEDVNFPVPQPQIDISRGTIVQNR